MAEQAGYGNGQGESPRPVPGSPDGLRRAPSRDSHLAGFAAGGEWDACPPSASLALALEAAAGPGWRCPGATRDEMFGLLRQWQALEARAVAGKLGILRALIREDDQPLPGGGYHGDLPEGWTKSLTHEVAAALSMPVVSADRLMWLAWDLEGRLPGVGGLLAAGELTGSKAKAVSEALQQLTNEDAAAAEAMIRPDLPGKTYGQVVKLAVEAALSVDPESATRRREDAERNRSRVTMFREESGAAALAGRDMPPDQALAAHASVCARAQEYKDSGAFPDDTRMDQYRVAAYLDMLNSVTAEARVAAGFLPGTDGAAPPPAGDEHAGDERGDDPGAGPGADGPGGPGGPGGEGPGGPGHDGPGPGAVPVPRLADLVVPLATLLGLAERPGAGYGLGPLDPALCRELASAAAGSPHSRLCVTVTDPDGIAIGHGCAHVVRRRKHPGRGKHPASADHDGAAERVRPRTVALPARLNVTISAACLAELARTTGPPGRAAWTFTRESDSGADDDGYGTWALTLPDGRSLTVGLRPVPTFECDHRLESHAYQPNDTLRHLVQVRDGECTFPPCSRHARESDFEHATPYDKGGRTCACNAGARSRACHQVKQSPGWKVTQPKPGWHQWVTPSGRTYVQAPKRYPA
jgi:Domain of unknown function (DUF222)